VRPDHVHAANRAYIAPPIDHCRSAQRGFPWDGAFPNDPPSGQSLSHAGAPAKQLGSIIDLYA
jgi:hypothetical protein